MEDIIRPMSKAELTKLTVDGVKGVNLNKSKQNLTAHEKFEVELRKQEANANLQGVPFARHVARDDFKTAIKIQVDKQLREFGSIEHPELIKLPEIDWQKYSDLKNFELYSEKFVPDANLSKLNSGLNVLIKTMKYKFKGYGQTYTVMESGPSAITRAIKKRAELDKSINQEIEEPKKSKVTTKK